MTFGFTWFVSSMFRFTMFVKHREVVYGSFTNEVQKNEPFWPTPSPCPQTSTLAPTSHLPHVCGRPHFFTGLLFPHVHLCTCSVWRISVRCTLFIVFLHELIFASVIYKLLLKRQWWWWWRSIEPLRCSGITEILPLNGLFV